MRLARRVFDSATPGLAQIGTMWLPLPHVLMWPFIWNDFLWRTGLAGAFAAMPCFIIAGRLLVPYRGPRDKRHHAASLRWRACSHPQPQHPLPPDDAAH